MNTSPLICHRGASAEAPENTLAAFELARSRGQRWIELDVCVTADGVAAVFHDERLERCTNGSGWLLQHRFAELAQLDAGGWFSEQFRGEPIPSLLSVLNWACTHDISLNLEIKPVSGSEDLLADAIVAALAQAPAVDISRLLFSSFNERSLQLARQTLPDIERALLVDVIPANAIERLQQLGCEGLHCHADLIDVSILTSVMTAGFSVRCFTVNSRSRAEALFACGVQSVFSDIPGLLQYDDAGPRLSG